ncbi:juvenile hormone acid O-methyltransferase-like [Anastrepha ludens]|uniref:juvenile hormone acid O-methyltransferase-like n=1 Tax=Anastrepha ludens TaxID=28586 RepID=UPI0023AE7EF2|nr:juvenile hormone acid O-methyltransferase-like [Anastrepha ludens]
MNEAALYHHASALQRRDAKKIFEECMKRMQWRADGCDRLIDIGSGPGSVLMEFVYPLLPHKFEAMWGTDLSEPMMDFACRNYGNTERTHFEVLDITCTQLPEHLRGQFDHVTSSYCLHWVKDQKRALQNIHQLLRYSGGDCLLVFLASNPFFDVYIELSKTEKWGRYMIGAMHGISPFHNSDDPGAEYSKLLQETGFVDFSVEIRKNIFVYEGTQNLKDNVKAVSSFMERIPEIQHEEFLDDFVKALINMKMCEGEINASNFKFIKPYTLFVVYARKPSEFLSSLNAATNKMAKRLD